MLCRFRALTSCFLFSVLLITTTAFSLSSAEEPEKQQVEQRVDIETLSKIRLRIAKLHNQWDSEVEKYSGLMRRKSRIDDPYTALNAVKFEIPDFLFSTTPGVVLSMVTFGLFPLGSITVVAAFKSIEKQMLMYDLKHPKRLQAAIDKAIQTLKNLKEQVELLIERLPEEEQAKSWRPSMESLPHS